MILKNLSLKFALTLTAALALSTHATAQELPDPDGEPADMTQPVQVYILMGQSNMLGFGTVNGDAEKTLASATADGLYPYLVDEDGNWTTRMDVRNVRVVRSGNNNAGPNLNDWLTITGGRIGPEIGIGHHLGHAIDAPVLVLKSCIGNRSLGWDLLPPGSERYQFTDGGTEWNYAGFGESPLRWEVGTDPDPIGWTAGIQYVGDTRRAQEILADLDTYYPGATEYEVAGFFWWQGDKDRYNAGHAAMYERNLVNLIEALRDEFDAPDAPFVCATLGQTQEGAGGNEGLIFNAQMAITDYEEYPDLEGETATVYTHPLSMGGASNSHYGGDARTYMNVGEAMGAAMVELLEDEDE